MLVIGTVVYNVNLAVFYKFLLMLSRQTVFDDGYDTLAQLVIQDNREGAQLKDIERFIKEQLPKGFQNKIQLVSSSNVGFGAGHNAIFNYATAQGSFDDYLCINPDGIPGPRMVEELLGFAKRRDNQGIFEARQVPLEHPKVYDPETGETAWASGCCVLIPSAVYQMTKGFDPYFFLYAEDVDFSWRVRKLGFRCYMVPQALFFHYVDTVKRDLKKQYAQMYFAGYKLGRKYGQLQFSEQCYEKLLTLMEKGELDRLVQEVEEQLKTLPVEEAAPFMDFTNRLYFSSIRW